MEEYKIKWMSWEEVQNFRIIEHQAIVKAFKENGLGWLLKFLSDFNKTTKSTLFRGIIKDINTFRYIMKLLEI